MAQRRDPSVASGLWVVALVALFLGALCGPATLPGFVALVLLGHGLTALGIALEPPQVPRPDGDRERRLTTRWFVAAALADLLAGAVSLSLAGWLIGLAWTVVLSLCIMAVVVSRRWVPDPPTFFCQLAVQATFLVPCLLAFPGELVLGGTAANLGWRIAQSLGVFMAVVTVALILIYLIISFLDRLNPSRPGSEWVWTLLLAHEVALVLFVVRSAVQ